MAARIVDYLLDTNSLIDAHAKWYRPHVFPSIWQRLTTDETVGMTSLVYAELRYPDTLVDWAWTAFKEDLLEPTSEIILAYSQVMNWVTTATRWNTAGIAQWQSPDKADPWLIATAMVNHQAIVTLDGNGHAFMPDEQAFSKQEPKISAVAEQFGVPTLTLYELLDKLHLSL